MLKPRTLDALTLAGGVGCLAVGVTYMAAWLGHVTVILRSSGSRPLYFNTALALAVTGAALVLLARWRWRWAVTVAGAFDVLLGLLVLAEYALRRGLGIDQLAVRVHYTVAHGAPGRLAINTAVCLVLTGIGLAALAPGRRRPVPAAVALAASLIAAIALVAAFGYASNIPVAYRWERLSGMTLLTALTLVALAVALLAAAWRHTAPGPGTLPRWLPLPAGVLALGVSVGIWLTLTGKAGHDGRVDAGSAAAAAAVLGLLMACLVTLVAWLNQRANVRSWLAQAEAQRRAEAEAQARASESRTRQFLDAMPVAVFVATTDAQPHYANKEAERLLGQGVLPRPTGLGLSDVYQTFVTGTDQRYPPEVGPVNRALRGQSSHVEDMEVRQPGGNKLQLEMWGRPVFDAAGQIEYAIAAFADISERNTRERTIAAQATLLDLAHDAVLVRDVTGQITYWNAGAEQTYGFTRSQALGQPSHELLQTEFPVSLADIEAKAAQGGWDGELRHRCADGRSIVVESRWVARPGPTGEVEFIEVNRDITARKAAEREAQWNTEEVQGLNEDLKTQIEQRTEHLERANRNLESFAYSIAHDLRTPLRGMSGFAEALAEDYSDVLDEAGRDYAARIQTASQRMAALIDDLLQLAQVSRAEITPEPVDLSEEAGVICEQLRAADPGRQADITIQPGIVVSADRSLIRLVLGNLLENAWKFTAGRESARIEFGSVMAGDGTRCCVVRDNGAGFDPAYAHKLFQPFQRLHAASDFPGTGIGLASVRQIIERHGGRAWAESTAGTGASFYFSLST